MLLISLWKREKTHRVVLVSSRPGDELPAGTLDLKGLLFQCQECFASATLEKDPS